MLRMNQTEDQTDAAIERILKRYPRKWPERMGHEESLRLNEAMQRGYATTLARHEAGFDEWEGVSDHATD